MGVIESAIGTVVQGLSAMPAPLQVAATSWRPSGAYGLELEPEVRMALMLMELTGQRTMDAATPEESREQIRREARMFGGRRTEVGSVVERTIDGPAGPIAARQYGRTSQDTRIVPLVVYFHGGGWVVGDLDTHDAVCRFLTRETGFDVLFVDYRLAPEDPFPAAVEDAVAAFEWAHANAAEIGVDASRIAVAGDSAGGNLAAVVAQETAAGKGPAPAFQLLVYPVTDLSTKHDSYTMFSEGYFLTESEMDWYRGHYIGNADGTDPRVSPLLAADLTGVAPAHVVTCGFDVLRDEGEAYARRLAEAGVPTTLRRHDGLGHGFVNAVGVGRASRSAGLEAARALRWALGLVP